MISSQVRCYCWTKTIKNGVESQKRRRSTKARLAPTEAGNAMQRRKSAAS